MFLRFNMYYASTFFAYFFYVIIFITSRTLFLGGWAGGTSGSEDMVKNADLMWKQSVWSSAITARLAHKFLATGGLVVLPGAEPAQSVDGTPGMIGYGMAKAAVHQLTR